MEEVDDPVRRGGRAGAGVSYAGDGWIMTHRSRHNPVPRRRSGFTLIEALRATGVLSLIVLAVGAAVTAGQHTTFEGKKAVLAAMAADDLMTELHALGYAGVDAHDGLAQAVGSMASLQGRAYPATYAPLGREAEVDEVIVEEPDTGVVVRGKRLVVRVYDTRRTIVELESFMSEPAP